ncbi:hypothetical protein LEP1GSC179_2528 [Leptospira santarosai str. MOR084]|uniref:Uncharacterized protein n=1 Tax=Leptospira santarosai str. MOR084 TaxID=1049984 RepID=A0A0E2BDM7_9LEPT|nr:hypothetical protein LEP1GSC179_2528 [Leptospira santarosai str. MOR084]
MPKAPIILKYFLTIGSVSIKSKANDSKIKFPYEIAVLS